MKKVLTLYWVIVVLAVGESFAPRVAAQTETGGSTKDSSTKTKEVKTRKKDHTARPTVRCEAGKVIVRCGTPGCTVSLGENQRGTTDATGELRFDAPSGTHSVVASKPYHEDARTQVRLACGETETVELRPKAKTVALRIRTTLPECDIYVNGSPSPVGRSDAQGVFNYQVLPSLLLIEARKKGYLSQMQRANVAPEGALGKLS